MKTWKIGALFLLILALGRTSVYGKLLYYSDVASDSYAVSYDSRSFIVAGNRTLFLSGSVHYPRSTPAMWDLILQAMREDGLNMVETYVFWNLHEPVRGQQFNFEGYANLTLFLEKAAEAGLFVNLRIGPYVCAEWNWGGLPLWLKNIDGMAVRSSNALWMEEMAGFVTKIAKIVTPFLAKNGGPIVLAQIENEYGWDDPAYIQWCGKLADMLEFDIPWLMCNGHSANDTINTCNGNDCAKYAEDYAQRFPGKPLAWTEDEGWFEEWDRAPNSTDYDNRTPQDMAMVILKWFARGGAHHNYYMWYGGNHYAQWAGNSVTNKYANGVNLHHDMLPNEPKKTHLQTLHRVLANYSTALLNYPSQVHNKYFVQVYDEKTKKYVTSKYQWVYIYDKIVIFLENEANDTVDILFGINTYTIRPHSIQVIDYVSMAVVYDSASVSYKNLATVRVYDPLMQKMGWKAWQESRTDLPGAFVASPPLEQLNLTMTDTDYLFYQTEVQVSVTGTVNVTVNSTDANSFLAFLDGKLQSHSNNNAHKYNYFNVTYSLPVTIGDTELHNLTLLSVNLGTDNGVSPGSFDSKGIVRGVSLGDNSLIGNMWLHRPKLEGEIKEIYTDEGSTTVEWSQDIGKFVNQPVVWFQTEFTRVEVKSGHSILLDLAGMGRGHIFLNGFPLGRYWLIQVGRVYVQRYYYIPPHLITDTNLLTLAEELGAADPESVRIVDSSFVVP